MSQPGSPNPTPDLAALQAENAALRERNELLTAVILNSPALVFAKDIDGKIVICNRRFEKLFGRDPGTMIGMTDFDYMSTAEAAEQVRENDRHIRETGTHVEFEENVTHEDGVHTYLSVKFPIYDLEGKVSGVGGIATDITDRKRGEEERQALQQRVIDIQRETLSELSTPIIPLAAGVIVMPLIGAFDGERAGQVVQALLEGLSAARAHTVIIDVTGVRAADGAVVDALVRAARAARMLGARAIVTGMRPALATAMIDLGLDTAGLETVGTVQAGVALALSRRTGAR